MFEQLQKKWKVGGLQLALIITTFAIGGSLTGYAARKLMILSGIGQVVLWIIIYILLVILIWPLAVVIVSIPLGQFSFFINYTRKIGRRIGIVGRNKPGVISREPIGRQRLADSDAGAGLMTTGYRLTTNIAIFASGTGTNSQKIIDRLNPRPSPSRLSSGEKGDSKTADIRVALIICNNPQAGVLKIAQKENIPALVIEKERFFRGDAYIKELQEMNIDWIVLAGFLWKIPDSLINVFRNKIINIHPALLPKWGGKGMYGRAVHEAVIAAKEKESGITIHYVDELYDHGKIIFQAKCPVLQNDTAETLAERIHGLEHEHYANVIEKLIVKGGILVI